MEGRGKKILFGCLGGCGAVVLIFIGSCVGFTMWLNSPADVLEPEILLGPETTGYVEWQLRLEDPGTAEFAEAMLASLAAINRQANSPLPDSLQAMIASHQDRQARRDMKKLFPIVVAWTESPGETDDEDLHLFSVSAAGMGHQLILADWIFGWVLRRSDRDVQVVRHRDEKIYLLRRENSRPAAFVRDGIVFATTDVASAQSTLDRLRAPAPESGAGAELEALFAALPADRPLRGAVTNRRGELRRIAGLFGGDSEELPDDAWNDVRGLTVHAGFRDEDVFAGAVELHGPDEAWASAAAASLGAPLRRLFEGWDVEFDTEIASVDRRVRVDFATRQLLEKVRELD